LHDVGNGKPAIAAAPLQHLQDEDAEHLDIASQLTALAKNMQM